MVSIADLFCREINIRNGFIHIFVPHSTAGVTINENADPNIQKDIINKLNELIQSKENSLVREEEKIRSFEQRINGFNLDRAKLVAETEALDKEFEPYRNERIKRNIVQPCFRNVLWIKNPADTALYTIAPITRNGGRL